MESAWCPRLVASDSYIASAKIQHNKIFNNVVKSTHNVLLTIKTICNYASQVSNNTPVIAKLVATFPDYM